MPIIVCRDGRCGLGNKDFNFLCAKAKTLLGSLCLVEREHIDCLSISTSRICVQNLPLRNRVLHVNAGTIR